MFENKLRSVKTRTLKFTIFFQCEEAVKGDGIKRQPENEVRLDSWLKSQRNKPRHL